jgi:hypothetical protein
MGREENVEVFNDTVKNVKGNPKLSDAVKYSTANQKLIPEGADLKAVYTDADFRADLIRMMQR